MIMSIVANIAFYLSWINTMLLHDPNQAFINLNRILSHNNPISYVIFTYISIPFGFPNPLY